MSYTQYGSSGGGFGSRFGMFPPVIKFLLIINVIIFGIQMLIDGIGLGAIIDWLALWSFESGNLMPWQFLTYQFLHGSFMHLFFNMFALWMFGMELERLMGSRKFLTFYLLCGIGAGLIHLGFSSLGEGAELMRTIGASGSVYGVILAFGLTFPDRTIIMFPLFFPIPARIFVFIYLAMALFNGLTNTSDGVAHFAHLGGAAVGYLLLQIGNDIGVYSFFDKIYNIFSPRQVGSEKTNVYTLNDDYSKKSSTPSWFKTEPKKTSHSNSGTSVPQEEIDRILEKISSSGYNSLTDKEKQALYEASKKL
jgi:membrane associated rhomboid family serine protease